jgi:hypothetical protein
MSNKFVKLHKLAAILEGEPPLDIFVRWKPLKEQAQGWHPDFNYGIRQNIRPFLLAGDVGKKGTNPLDGKDFVGTRWNAVHLTLARKKEACS